MSNAMTKNMMGMDNARVCIEWSDSISCSNVSCALVGAPLSVSIDPGGSSHIWAVEASVPSEYLDNDKYSPSRSLTIHISFLQLESLQEEIKRAIKAYKKKYHPKKS